MQSICGCQRLDLCISEHGHVFLFTWEWIKRWFINSPLVFPTLSHPPLSSGELISCLTHAPRQTGRQTEGREIAGKMMGAGRRLRGIRVARVKLETHPFNMSYLSILSVKGGTRGVTLTAQRPNSIQWWNHGQLLTSGTKCSSSGEIEMWCKTPLTTPAKGKKTKGETGRGLPHSLTNPHFYLSSHVKYN